MHGRAKIRKLILSKYVDYIYGQHSVMMGNFFASSPQSRRRPPQPRKRPPQPRKRPPQPRLRQPHERPIPLTASRPKDNTLFQYVAPGGGKVMVPRIVKPHDELNVASSAPQSEIKAAFKRDTMHNERQRRMLASLSYHMLTCPSTVQRYRRCSNGRDYEIEHRQM